MGTPEEVLWAKSKSNTELVDDILSSVESRRSPLVVQAIAFSADSKRPLDITRWVTGLTFGPSRLRVTAPRYDLFVDLYNRYAIVVKTHSGIYTFDTKTFDDTTFEGRAINRVYHPLSDE